MHQVVKWTVGTQLNGFGEDRLQVIVFDKLEAHNLSR